MESFDWVAVATRVAAFVAALQAAGLALFLAAHRTALGASVRPLSVLARGAALTGFALVIGHQAMEGARLAGEWPGLWDAGIQRGNWQRSPGLSALVAAFGLAVEFLGLKVRGAPGRALALAGALGVAGSFALTGHTTEPGVPPLVRAALALHVGIAAYWLGSVAGLLRLTQLDDPPVLETASWAFSARAVWLVPAILPLGVGLAAGLMANVTALFTVYGALLAIKFVGFSILLGLAAFNRWQVLPALRREPAAAARRFRRTLQAEYAMLATVLAVTAAMTSFFSWR
jgi:copper resistance protein D